jgi:GTPase SAR1 family protein
MKWYKEILRIEAELKQTKWWVQFNEKTGLVRPFVVVLCGTKSDIKQDSEARGGDDAKGFVSRAQALTVAKNIRADAFVECSALSGAGVRGVFDASLKAWFALHNPPPKLPAPPAESKLALPSCVIV